MKAVGPIGPICRMRGRIETMIILDCVRLERCGARCRRSRHRMPAADRHRSAPCRTSHEPVSPQRNPVVLQAGSTTGNGAFAVACAEPPEAARLDIPGPQSSLLPRIPAASCRTGNDPAIPFRSSPGRMGGQRPRQAYLQRTTSPTLGCRNERVRPSPDAMLASLCCKTSGLIPSHQFDGLARDGHAARCDPDRLLHPCMQTERFAQAALAASHSDRHETRNGHTWLHGTAPGTVASHLAARPATDCHVVLCRSGWQKSTSRELGAFWLHDENRPVHRAGCGRRDTRWRGIRHRVPQGYGHPT